MRICWRLLAGALEAVTAQIVAQAAEAGDALAQAVLDDAARMLGLGLRAAISLLNPERVVLGGGVTKSGERLVAHGARDERAITSLPSPALTSCPPRWAMMRPLWGAAALAETVR